MDMRHQKPGSHRTALVEAAAKDDISLLNALLRTPLSTVDDDELNEALLTACLHGSHVSVSLLLGNGADVNCTTCEHNNTGLMLASANGHLGRLTLEQNNQK